MTIRDDKLVENEENFFLDIEISSTYASRGVIKGAISSTMVVITDDDCECCSNGLYPI